MKKKLSIILAVLIISSIADCSVISADDNSSTNILLKEVSGSSDLIGVKALLNSLDYDTNWESTSKTLYATKNKNVIEIKLNSDIAKLNGNEIKMNGKAVLKDDSMYITLASAKELTGEEINSDGLIIKSEETSDESWKDNKISVDLASVSDSMYEITEAGIYSLSGTYNGMIYVNSSGKVKLVLDNVNIKNEANPAIFFENSKKGIIELADNSDNILSDGTKYSVDAKGCIFSNDDLDIQGSGKLTVNSNYDHGIVSDDDIEIKEGSIYVNTVVGDGIKANGAVKIKSGNISLNVKGDGISGDECVVIDNGNVNITTTGDIIESDDNEFDFKMGFEQHDRFMPNMEDENNEMLDRSMPYIKGERPEMPKEPMFDIGDKVFEIPEQMKTEDDNSELSDESNISSKAIKSDRNITINGGEITISSTDHGIKCDDIIVINDGKLNIKSDISKGIKAMGNIFINGGDVDVNTKDECIESKATITINDGNINLTSTGDDAINAGGGLGARMMKNVKDGNEHQIIINGGNLVADSKGDGLDSNGNLFFYGGNVLVKGPTSGGDGALDSGSALKYYGGNLMALGSIGMVECPESENGSVLNISLDEIQKVATSVAIMDSSNNTIYSTVSEKEFQSVIFASDKLKVGEEYSLYLNGKKTVSLKAVTGVAQYGNAHGIRDAENKRDMRGDRGDKKFNEKIEITTK